MRSFRKNALANVAGSSKVSAKFVKVAVGSTCYLRKVDLEAYANYDQLLPSSVMDMSGEGEGVGVNWSIQTQKVANTRELNEWQIINYGGRSSKPYNTKLRSDI